MRIIDAAELTGTLDYASLVDALAEAFAAPPEAPTRHHHTIATGGEAPDATLLLMPAWMPGELIGIKSVTVFPGNSERGLPAVSGSYLLLDGVTGAPLAMIDGTALTLVRTAAVSALAAGLLAPEGTKTLLMVGTGALAPYLIAAHCAVRTYERVVVWGRDPEKAHRLAAETEIPGAGVEAADSLDDAQQEADVITVATLSTEPLVKGSLLQDGTHVDLVGAFQPEMRESDDALMARGRLFVDTRAGALAEAGDIIQAIASGAMDEKSIVAELSEIDSPGVWQRQSPDEITVFKSVGSAVSDLAAARLLWQRLGSGT